MQIDWQYVRGVSREITIFALLFAPAFRHQRFSKAPVEKVGVLIFSRDWNSMLMYLVATLAAIPTLLLTSPKGFVSTVLSAQVRGCIAFLLCLGVLWFCSKVYARIVVDARGIRKVYPFRKDVETTFAAIKSVERRVGLTVVEDRYGNPFMVEDLRGGRRFADVVAERSGLPVPEDRPAPEFGQMIRGLRS